MYVCLTYIMATYFLNYESTALELHKSHYYSLLSFQFRDATGDTVQTLRLRVPPLATLLGGSSVVVNGSMLHRAGPLGARATADLEIFLLNTVWLPVYIYNTYVLYVYEPYSHDCIIYHYTVCTHNRYIEYTYE